MFRYFLTVTKWNEFDGIEWYVVQLLPVDQFLGDSYSYYSMFHFHLFFIISNVFFIYYRFFIIYVFEMCLTFLTVRALLQHPLLSLQQVWNHNLFHSHFYLCFISWRSAGSNLDHHQTSFYSCL